MTADAPTMPDPTPTVESGMLRRLPVGVIGSFGVAAVLMAAIVELGQKPGWWNGFVAASIIAAIAAAASLLVLGRAGGRRVDEAVTLAMGASGVRMAVCAVGLLVAINALDAPAEPTGFVLCGYYAATLVLLARLAFDEVSRP